MANNLISEELNALIQQYREGQGPVRVPRGAHLYIKGWLPSI